MKRNNLLLFAFGSVLFMTCGETHAVLSNCLGMACAMDYDPINPMPLNCASYTDYCYNSGGGFTGQGGSRVYNCTRCNSGYKQDNGYVEVSGCSNKIPANNCIPDCTGCSNCTSDTSWSAGNTGYEKKVTRTCNCNTCTATTSYRCAAGYYGSSTNGTSGCTRCPASDVYTTAALLTKIYGTSIAGTTVMTSCYIPAGTTFYDNTGSGTYEEASYYCD